MDKQIFESKYRGLIKRLGKERIFNDDYINNAAGSLRVEMFQEDIINKVFKELSDENPQKVDLSTKIIRGLYWAEFQKQRKEETSGERHVCKYKLCNGMGLVITEKKVGDIIVNYGFRCICFMGHWHDEKILMWNNKYKEKGHSINKEDVYVEPKDEIEHDASNIKWDKAGKKI